MPVMPMIPARSAVRTLSPGVAVDRENRILRGYVLAQVGDFKSQGRGRFDASSLQRIVELMREQPAGLKSRFTHPTMSDDGLGSFLGRVKSPRIDGDRVRGDLLLDPVAFSSPRGNLGQYVLDLAASDPDALSSSLVLKTDQTQTLDDKGRPLLGPDGEEIPPLWMPTKLLASDVVDVGEAVDGLLSHGVDPDGLPLAALWKGCEMLDRLFAGASREAVEARLGGFVGRYLSMRFGDAPTRSDEIRKKLGAMK